MDELIQRIRALFSERISLDRSRLGLSISIGSLDDDPDTDVISKILDRGNFVFGANHLLSKIRKVHSDFVEGSVRFESEPLKGFEVVNIPLEDWGEVPLQFQRRGSGILLSANISILVN